MTNLTQLPAAPKHSSTVGLSVGDFFQQINWSGKPASKRDQELLADAPYETVGQFFADFPWQGTVAIVSDDWELLDDDPPLVSLDDDALTLEDLSALF